MKKWIAILVAVMIFTSMLTGCFDTSAAAGEGKLKIVATIFPAYDWIRQILGNNMENVQLTLLLDNGVDLHSYQPTADDIVKVSTCDLFVYVGGESDQWVGDVLKESVNQDMVVLNLLEVLGDRVKEEEMVEGMEAEEESEEEGDAEYDEHVWLSLKNAMLLCACIGQELCQLDGENAESYTANVNAYISQLEALDVQYQAVVNSAQRKTILFGDRFPFRYLADDYGLTYYAAFSGCSAETEASFETITFLAEKVDALALPCVLTLEGTDHKIAQTVISATQTKDQTVLTMDSLQSTTSADVKNGATYLSIMEKNLGVLEEALK